MKFNIQSTPFLLAFIFILAGLLVGCTGGGDGPNVLQVGNGAEPTGLDPHRVTGVPESRIIRSLIEGLVSKAETTLEPIPAGCERWEVAEDGMTYTFFLRKNAVWSDGHPVTSGDYRFAIERVLHPDSAAQFAYLLFDVKNAQAFNKGDIGDFSDVGIATPDDHTLVLTLGQPNPFLLNLLSHYTWYPVPKHVVLSRGKMTDPDSDWTRPEHFVGNGAFVLTEWRMNDSILVNQSTSYWDAASVKLDGIRFHAVTQAETEERMFRSGQLHVTSTIPLQKIASYRERNDPSLVIYPQLGIYYFRFNTQRKGLDDVRVRRALSMAVDREELTAKVTGGEELPAFHMVPPGNPDYKAPELFKYDPEVARSLLAEAGYPGGEGFPVHEILFNTSEAHREISETIADMWKQELGIEVKMRNMEWKAYLEEIDQEAFDMCRAGWLALSEDPRVFLDMWMTGKSMNRTGWSSSAYDKLIEESNASADLSTRLKLLQDAETLLMTDMPVMPLYHYTSKYLQQPVVKGRPPNALDFHVWKRVRLDLP